MSSGESQRGEPSGQPARRRGAGRGSRNPWWWALLAIVVVMWCATIAKGFRAPYLGWTLVYTIGLGTSYLLLWVADRLEEGRRLLPWRGRRTQTSGQGGTAAQTEGS